jgi:hypothetical protein
MFACCFYSCSVALLSPVRVSTAVLLPYFHLFVFRRVQPDHLVKEHSWIDSRDGPWFGQPRNRGSNPSSNKGFFSSQKPPYRLWGPPTILFNGYRGSFPGVKWLGRKHYHLPLSCSKVKNAWSYTFTPPYAFMAFTDNSLRIHLIGWNILLTILLLRFWFWC